MKIQTETNTRTTYSTKTWFVKLIASMLGLSLFLAVLILLSWLIKKYMILMGFI